MRLHGCAGWSVSLLFAYNWGNQALNLFVKLKRVFRSLEIYRIMCILKSVSVSNNNKKKDISNLHKAKYTYLVLVLAYSR